MVQQVEVVIALGLRNKKSSLIHQFVVKDILSVFWKMLIYLYDFQRLRSRELHASFNLHMIFSELLL